MIREQLLERARREFDQLAAERYADIRRRFHALGYSDAEIDDIFKANEPNMQRARRELARIVAIETMRIEALDG